MDLNKLCGECAQPPARSMLSVGLRRVLLLVFLLFMVCGFALFTAKQLSVLARLKKARVPAAVPVSTAVKNK